MTRRFLLPLLGAIASSIIGFLSVRLINLHLGNSSLTDRYFQLLIIYSFFTSFYTSVLVYIQNQIIIFLNPCKNVGKWVWHSAVLVAITLALYIDLFNFFIIGISSLIIEIWAVKMINSNRYFFQQIIRQISALVTLLGLLFFGKNVDLIVTFYVGLGVLVGTVLFLHIFDTSASLDFNGVLGLSGIGTQMKENRVDASVIAFLVLTLLVKFIPIVESQKLVTIAMLSTIVYSSKLPNVIKAILEQMFGVNLLNYFQNLSQKRTVMPLILFLVSSLFMLFFLTNSVELSVNILGLNHSRDLQTLKWCANLYFLTLPISLLSILLKNIAFNFSGNKPIVYVLLIEILLAVFLFFFLFDNLAFRSAVYFYFLSWALSAFIFMRYSRFSSSVMFLYFLTLLIYVVVVVALFFH